MVVIPSSGEDLIGRMHYSSRPYIYLERGVIIFVKGLIIFGEWNGSDHNVC